MNILSTACKIASLGAKIFPLIPNGKTPTKSGWMDMATSKPDEIETMLMNKRLNYGVTNILAIDVDQKNGKNGVASINQLIGVLGELPQTLTVSTPSGGYHYYFQAIHEIGNSIGKIGEGLDIRSTGGYVVGPESVIDGRKYFINNDVSNLPELPEKWKNHLILHNQTTNLVTARIKTNPNSLSDNVDMHGIHFDSPESISMARQYLMQVGTPSIEGCGGDANSIKVIRRVRDYGISERKCLEMLIEYWNQRCVPPWSQFELQKKVRSGYRNAQNRPGCLSPSSFFTAIKKF